MRTLAVTLLIACLTHISLAADTPFPENMVTLRAQPAVFPVRTVADVELMTPASVRVDLDVLKADHDKLPNAGAGQTPGMNRHWLLLAQDPGKYLVASREQKKWEFKDAIAGWGSAFAISREGILLTNAHVVSDMVWLAVPRDNWPIFDQAILRDGVEIEKQLGSMNLEGENFARLKVALYGWYGPRSRMIGKFKSAHIVLSYVVDPRQQLGALKARDLTAALSLKPTEIVAPVTVLAVGESLPGKDVAVLKVIFEPAEQARLVRLSQQQKLPGLENMLAEIQNDRMICLPLGNSEDVLPQDRIQALGFPGIAFSSDSMEEEARFKVSSRGGQISQSKRMSGSGGWDAFEISASIEHGDSGGPVLDARGNVIAINVGSARDEPGVLRLAVPINLAKPLLAKAGITPQVGKLSEHWEQALRLFAAGKFAAAEQQIVAAKKLQQGGNVLSGREVSWYLKEMHGRCLQKLGKIPGGR